MNLNEMRMEIDFKIVNNLQFFLSPPCITFFFLIGKLKALRKYVYKLGEISSHSPLLNPSLPKKRNIAYYHYYSKLNAITQETFRVCTTADFSSQL